MIQADLNKKIRGIYAITPDHTLELDNIENTIKKYNIQILQYRRKNLNANIQLKEAEQLQQLCQKHHTLFIINDDINLAQKIKADGVHLGAHDGSISAARSQLGKDAIIGASCYQDINLALKAQDQDANYAAFGALFPSSTKPNAPHCPLDIVTQAKRQIHIPVVGIGGITFDNQQQAFDAGCDSVAMIGTLFYKK